jgi:membrane-associated phospholipid phosphatase
LLLTVIFFYTLRSFIMYLCVLPVPVGQLYFDPGFPTFSTNYNLTNDLFYSGHAGFATLVFLELRAFNYRRLSWLYFVFMLFISFILILTRTHYTMDVYAGILSAYFLFKMMPKVLSKLETIVMRSREKKR